MSEAWIGLAAHPPGHRAVVGKQRQDAATASFGEEGARVAVACRPTRTVWPGASAAAQSAPRHVTVVPDRLQVIPQAFETAVVPGASNETCHRETVPVAVTSTSAT